MSRSSSLWALIVLATAWILRPDTAQAQRPRFSVGAAIDIAAGDPGPQAVALGDVNNDGRTDIVVISIEEDDGPVAVLINEGNGTFSAPRFVTDDNAVLSEPVAIAVADVGGVSGGPDGNADIIVVDTLEGGFAIAFGDGSGNFTIEGDEVSTVEGIDTPVALAVADFNGLNGPDLAIVDGDGDDDNGEVFFLCNEGLAGLFLPCPTSALTTSGELPIDMGAGDFNNDGNVDVVVLNQGGAAGEGRVALFTGSGGGAFTIPQQATFPVANEPRDLVVARLNPLDDGIDDVAVAEFEVLSDDNVTILLGGTTGAIFTRPAKALLELGTTALTVGNFGGDTSVDLLGGNDPDQVTSIITVATGDGTGAFQAPQQGGTLGGGALSLVAGRLNDDDLDDFVVLNLDATELRIALNTANQPTETPGTPSPGSPTVSPTPTPTRVITPSLEACTVPLAVDPVAMAQGDLDGDGSPDLAVASDEGAQLLVMLTEPARLSGPNAPCDYRRTVAYSLESPLGPPTIVDVVVGDLNRDDRPDIVVVATDGLWILVATGNSGSFSQARKLDVATSDPRSVALMDFDGGGIVDLAVANHGNGTVAILFGLGDAGVNFEERAATQPPLAVEGANIVVASNLNEDDRPDMAVASDADDSVRIFLQAQAGSPLYPIPTPPAQVPRVSLAGGDPVAMVAARLTSSPIAQLVVVMRNALGVGTLATISRPGTTFVLSPVPPLQAGRNPSGIAIGDFVQGGDREDAAVTSAETGVVLFFAGTSGGSFMPAGTSDVGDTPMSIVGGDFDLDGRDDLAVANLDSGDLTLLLSSRVPPTPPPTVTYTIGPSNTPTVTGTPGPSLTPTRGTPAATSTPKEGAFELSSCSITPPNHDPDGASVAIVSAATLLWWARRRSRSRRSS